MTIVYATLGVTILALIAYRLVGDRFTEVYLPPPRGVAACMAPVNLRDIMMVVVSLAVLGSSLFVILSGRYDDGTQKWAFGAVGSMVGFWLRPGK